MAIVYQKVKHLSDEQVRYYLEHPELIDTDQVDSQNLAIAYND